MIIRTTKYYHEYGPYVLLPAKEVSLSDVMCFLSSKNRLGLVYKRTTVYKKTFFGGVEFVFSYKMTIRGVNFKYSPEADCWSDKQEDFEKWIHYNNNLKLLSFDLYYRFVELITVDKNGNLIRKEY